MVSEIEIVDHVNDVELVVMVLWGEKRVGIIWSQQALYSIDIKGSVAVYKG